MRLEKFDDALEKSESRDDFGSTCQNSIEVEIFGAIVLECVTRGEDVENSNQGEVNKLCFTPNRRARGRVTGRRERK